MKASQIRRDDNGVPQLNREFIENKAIEIIEYYKPSVLKEPQLTPLAEISLSMSKEFNIPFIFDQDLGCTKKGNKILGKFRIESRSVFVDASLDPNDPRWRFTLAHEIGHLIFHRSLRLVENNIVEHNSEITDTVRQILRFNLTPKTPYEWLEWQANKFAASLLMPNNSIRKALALWMSAESIRRPGYLYVDNEYHNIETMFKALNHLKMMYQTSSKATEVRLKELNLLNDVRNNNFKHVVELLREETT